MNPVVQSLDGLTLRCVSGEISWEPLRVLESRQCFWKGWAVTIAVLGASHALCFARNGVFFTELLTCGTLFESGTILFETKGAGQGVHTLECNGLRWKTTVIPFLLVEGDRLQGGFEESLTAEYPLVGSATPVTRIGWNIGERFYAQTIHTYPEEGMGVRTVTFVEARGEL